MLSGGGMGLYMWGMGGGGDIYIYIKCSVSCHSGSGTPISAISVMQCAMSSRLSLILAESNPDLELWTFRLETGRFQW